MELIKPNKIYIIALIEVPFPLRKGMVTGRIELINHLKDE